MSDLRPRSGRRNNAGIARHGRLRSSSPWMSLLAFVGVVLAVVGVSGASIVAIEVAQLRSNIKTVTLPGETPGVPPPNIASYPGGFNILIAGSDTRAGQGGIGGTVKQDGGTLNDVNIVLHVSADHTNAIAVSFPRDMVVPIPSCPRSDGKGSSGAMAAQPLNVALSYGGLPCVALTIEKLTGLNIQFAGLITFTGVINMSDAIGGVPVCVAGAIKDPYTGLNLPAAGTYNLQGADALAFLRSRHGVGDGSDLGRISSQQVYLSALVRKLKSADTLGNPATVFKLATAATQSMTLSSGFSQLDTMASIAFALKDIPVDRVTFVQYPNTTGIGGVYAGKVAPIKAQDQALMNLILADKPVAPDPTATSRGSVETTPPPTATASPAPSTSASPSAAAPSASAAPSTTASAPTVVPGLIGQTAAQYTCSKPYKG